MVLYAPVKVGKLELCAKFPWKIGIVLFMAFPETLKGEKVLEAVKTIVEDEYFDLIEVPAYDKETLKKIVKLASDYGVEVNLALQPEILLYKFNVNALDESERKKASERIISKIKDGADVGIYKAALCSGPRPPEDKVEDALASLEKSMTEILEEAENLGVFVALESFDTEHDKKLLIGKLETAAKFIRGLKEKGYKNIGLLWDLSHAPLLDEKPSQLKDVVDILAHVHIGCAKKTPEGLKDWHPTFHTPGALNTEEDVADLLEVLYDIGYSGAVSFEVKPEAQQTSLEAVNAAKGTLLRAFSMMIRKEF